MGFELDPCWVHGEGGELIAAGHVRTHEDDRLVVEAPKYSGGSLWPGDPVVLVVASQLRGSCTIDAVVQASARTRLELADLRIRVVEQKRTAVRVPVSEHVTFAHVAEGDQQVPLEEPVAAQVLDLSAYGMRFRSETQVPTGTRLVGTYPTPQRPVPIVVEVLRHEELRGAVGHGGRFVGMSERDTETLFRAVLDRQRRLIAERRDAI
ncbi:PilZ domain-containing protein [Actinotalea fermentans]|uniref:PilZ domain-containing protein n=1 Tax=Actinotalea fermentans TaxID=43671 RepID=A0A511YUR4_9CELL|nr:PilZ domain-containing protein [Actinotalea fermentans]KGM17470.1 hypothetical protein N867_02995 [Actinotalea fermentans ATCC 43279 = JCM 9966 = DSM 3133]GEN78929.1 hypothetical protein AFE02nite_06630 [Actinotalea fermentans]